MSRTKAQPVCVRPTQPHEIPLTPCSRCDRVQWEAGGEVCVSCSGGGFACVAGNLGPTFSYLSRPFLYNPGLRKLWLERKGKREEYAIREFRADPLDNVPCRAFTFAKISTGDVYTVECAGSLARCDCKGYLTDSTHWANRRAFECGEVGVQSWGCVHCDSVQLFLLAGLMEVK